LRITYKDTAPHDSRSIPISSTRTFIDPDTIKAQALYKSQGGHSRQCEINDQSKRFKAQRFLRLRPPAGARSISVVGDFNSWEMVRTHLCRVTETASGDCLSDIKSWRSVQFEIRSKTGEILLIAVNPMLSVLNNSFFFEA